MTSNDDEMVLPDVYVEPDKLDEVDELIWEDVGLIDNALDPHVDDVRNMLHYLFLNYTFLMLQSTFEDSGVDMHEIGVAPFVDEDELLEEIDGEILDDFELINNVPDIQNVSSITSVY